MMNFFDPLLDDFHHMTGDLSGKSSPFSPDELWPDAGYSEVILKRDTAFELDGTGFLLATEKPIAGSSDMVTVIGEDLQEIRKDRKFARVALVQIEETIPEEKYYDTIKKIEFVKYHYFPVGYMLRTSTKGHREVVRVSGKALQAGITFGKTGNLFLKKLREIPEVRQVHLCYLTDPLIDFPALEAMAERNEQITQTLNHVSTMLTFDCAACARKPICDEVDGMRELHRKLYQRQ